MAISARFREVWLRPFEKMEDGSWWFGNDAAFRAVPEPGTVEPTYPDFLE